MCPLFRGQFSRGITEDVDSYALKSDAIRRGLMNADKRDAYVRALVHLVGAGQVVNTWDETA